MVIFMGMVSLANCLLSKGNKDNYEVNDAEKGGKENTAFDNESDSKKDQQQQQQQMEPPPELPEKKTKNGFKITCLLEITPKEISFMSKSM